ncbi:MAG: FmdB family zinc ribbon protein [Ktedonobacteraceae bacterium]
MPTYEYLCQACSHRFEQWQHMTDDALTICPECGGHIRRVFFPAGIVFKGHGFYKTDHGSSTVAESNGNGNEHKEQNTKAETTATETKASKENTTSESGKSSSSTSNENKAPVATTTQ